MRSIREPGRRDNPRGLRLGIAKTLVQDVTYYQQGKGEGIKLKAISYGSYDNFSVCRALVELIQSKNDRCSEYRQVVSPVDLVINDVDNLSAFAEFPDLIGPFRSSKSFPAIRDSGFREIYLLTRSRQGVCIPLRACLFASEVVTFANHCNGFCKDSGTQMTAGDFMLSLAAFLIRSFPNAEYTVPRPGKVGYVFGSVACYYEDDCSKLTVDDITTRPVDSQPLAPDVEHKIDEKFSAFIDANKSYWWLPLTFPVTLPVETE